jgi:hypothetical protein
MINTIVFKSHICNCDESCVQVGHNSGGRVLAKKDSHYVYGLIPKASKWISIFACVNATKTYVPSFYIYRDHCCMCNYIKKCEIGVTMGM